MELKKLKLIYNPFSGDKSFKFDLDACVLKFQSAGYEVHLFRSINKNDIDEHFKEIKKGNYDAFVVSGGDGTINIVINAMMNNNLNDVPLGIISSGTANDFAAFLKLPKETEHCCDIIIKNNIKYVDVGKVNNKYFINVCAGGLFSNISQNVDKDFKDCLGKLAYYIKGIEQIPKFAPVPVRITNSKEVIESTINLFLVLNSSGTGGIEKLAPDASINDGLFDFIAFRNFVWHELPGLLLKFLKGDYLNDTRIIYFKDNNIKIEDLSDDNRISETDLDGEQGPDMPVEIENIHNAVRIFYP